MRRLSQLLTSDQGSITTAMAFIIVASTVLGIAVGTTLTRTTIDTTMITRAVASSAVANHAQALIAEANVGGWKALTVGAEALHPALGVSTTVTAVERDAGTGALTISLLTEPVAASVRPRIVSTLTLAPVALGALAGIDAQGRPTWTSVGAGGRPLAIYDISAVQQ